jgi:2-polyprenyl-3-methyl-5-hydroxy-6-metoxy-1,4-benzoquinol methylase
MGRIDRLIVKFMPRDTRQRIIAKYAVGRIIDVGCAQMTNRFLPDGVTGFDIKNLERLPKNYSRFVRGDAQELSGYFREKFDTVIISEIIEHVENPVKLLRECNKILRTGGRLIVNTDNPYRFQTLFGNVLFPKGLMSSDEHICYFPPRTLNKIALREGFELIHMTPGEGMNFPLLRLEWLYVYRKKRNLLKH